jgi:hypothetical protein
LENKRFEIRGPAMWSGIKEYKEPTYDEVVVIRYGVGHTDKEHVAKRLQKFGYIIKDLQAVEESKEVEELQPVEEFSKDEENE